jgi:hypothetical protein
LGLALQWCHGLVLISLLRGNGARVQLADTVPAKASSLYGLFVPMKKQKKPCWSSE